MKYLVRSVKYLIYFFIIFCICLALVVLFSRHSFSEIPEMLKNGELFKENSLLYIVLIFVGCAALYPAFGFRKGRMQLNGDWKEYRDSVAKTMEGADYKLVREDDHTMVWRHSRPLIRLTRMWEDTITFSVQEKDPSLVLVDGPSRDTFKIIRAVLYNHRMSHPQNEE